MGLFAYPRCALIGGNLRGRRKAIKTDTRTLAFAQLPHAGAAAAAARRPTGPRE